MWKIDGVKEAKFLVWFWGDGEQRPKLCPDKCPTPQATIFQRPSLELINRIVVEHVPSMSQKALLPHGSPTNGEYKH